MITTLYTKKEVAELFGVSEITIHRFVTSGKLSSTKIGGKRMFTEKHLNDLIKNSEV